VPRVQWQKTLALVSLLWTLDTQKTQGDNHRIDALERIREPLVASGGATGLKPDHFGLRTSQRRFETLLRAHEKGPAAENDGSHTKRMHGEETKPLRAGFRLP